MVYKKSHDSQEKILTAAIDVIRAKGYAAATVNDVCDEAGVTKGSFFHQFESKDAMTLAAAELWDSRAQTLFASAPYQDLDDPLDRLLGYVDFRRKLVQGDIPQFSCFFGTLVQETYETHPHIRSACGEGIKAHIAALAKDAEAAKALYCPNALWSAESVATFAQTVVQGSFVLAKALQNPQAAIDSLDHLERYFISLFDGPASGPALEP